LRVALFAVKPGTARGLSKILQIIEIHLVANSHPREVNTGIGLLRKFEGFSFVSGFALPNKPFMSSWSSCSSEP
jgi:hypothetical protein